MRTTRTPVVHVVEPGIEVARELPRSGETITAFLRRTGWAKRDRSYGWRFKKDLPTVVLINGEAVLRRRWSSTRIRTSDQVRFVSMPAGGKQTKQIIGVVALVALTAFSGGIASALLGSTASTVLFGSLTAGQALAAGIVAAGALAIGALTAPKPGGTNDPNATTDQIYTANAAGNQARLGQPLPVGYGRERVFPDFAAQPWGEFVGNDQYQNILLSVGMGSYEYEQLLIDDTPFWDPVSGVISADAQVAFYEPGAPVTLFPVNVTSAAEVHGQQLPTSGDWLGGFIANAAGTVANAIAVDYVFPAGCFTVNDDGETLAFASGMIVQWRHVNDAGVALSDWHTGYSESVSRASRSPIRGSIKFAIEPGRVEVRFCRYGGVPSENKGAAEIVWAGLRTFIQGSNTFGDISTIAIRIRASQSTQGSFRFAAIRTRKLPVWEDGSWVTKATRSPTWAAFDIATNQQYGARHPVSKVDFNTFVNHAAGCDAREDSFDYTFNAAVSVPEALKKALAVARSKEFWLGDTISIVRDEPRIAPAMLLTDREIVRDSTQISFTMLGEDDPDAVALEYIDEDTWQPAQVQYPPNTEVFEAVQPSSIRVDGILNRDHAFRECAYWYLQSIYRRERVTIGCEYEGRAITFGSTIRIQSELPQVYGQAGGVVDVSGRTLTLHPAPIWETDTAHFVRLRQANGKVFGPIGVTRGSDDHLAILVADGLADAEDHYGKTLVEVLARADGAEYPSYDFGTADNQSRDCIVISGRPNGEQFEIETVVDDPRVHDTDLGSPPVLPVKTFPNDARVPIVAGLNALFDQGVTEPVLSASWFPAAGAVYYLASVSYDDGETWADVYEGQANQFTANVTLGALRLRVQAVGVVRGPYSTVDLEAPTIRITTPIVSMRALTEGIRFNIDQLQQVKKEVRDLDAALNDKLARLAAFAHNQGEVQNEQVYDQRQDLISLIEVSSDQANASIEDVRSVAAGTNVAFAAYKITVTAQLGDMSASVTETAAAIADVNGILGSSYSLSLDTNGHIVGYQLTNAGAGSSQFSIRADKLQFQLPGYNGGAAVNALTVGTVNGVPAFGFVGNIFLDGELNGIALKVNTVHGNRITTHTLNATHITAGSFTSASGVFGALGVDTLSIAGEAVTVMRFTSVTLSTTGGPLATLSTSIATAGSTGMTFNTLITAFAGFRWSGATGAYVSATMSVRVNGGAWLAATNAVPGIEDGSIVLMVPYSFVATGSPHAIVVEMEGAGILHAFTKAVITLQTGKR